MHEGHLTKRHPQASASARVWIVGVALLPVLVAACSAARQGAANDEEPAEPLAAEPTATTIPTPTPTPTVTPIPTPDYTDALSIPSLAADTPEVTFDAYLRDAIAQQVSIQREKLDMRLRYQNPTTLLQDAGGLVLDIELVEDRSRRTILRERSATFEVEIDVRVTFADEDTSTLTCAWTVTLQKSGDLWYVVNPRELLLFVNCA